MRYRRRRLTIVRGDREWSMVMRRGRRAEVARAPRLIGHFSAAPQPQRETRLSHACGFVRRATAASDPRPDVFVALLLEIQNPAWWLSHVVVEFPRERLPRFRGVVRHFCGGCWSASPNSGYLHEIRLLVCVAAYDWGLTFLARPERLLLHGRWRRASHRLVDHASRSSHAGGRGVRHRINKTPPLMARHANQQSLVGTTGVT